MNHNVKQFNKELSAKHYAILNLLSKYSCKVIGVSHLKIETIAKQLNKSVATVKRYISYLKQNGFISILNTCRIKKGGKGANVYVINSTEQRTKIKNELSQMSYRKQSKKDGQTLSRQAMAYVKIKKETIFFKAILNSFIGIRSKRKAHLKRVENIKSFRQCPSDVPLHIYKSNSAFFTDEQIKVMYRIAETETNQFTMLDDTDKAEIIENTFKAVVIAMRKHYKNGADPVNNIFAYARSTAKRMSRKQASIDMFSFLN